MPAKLFRMVLATAQGAEIVRKFRAKGIYEAAEEANKRAERMIIPMYVKCLWEITPKRKVKHA